jgi:hypothetical protein
MRSYVQPGRCALVLVAALASIASSSGVVYAQSIEDARGHWFDANFEAARDAFDAVLRSPELTVAQAKDAPRNLAVLHMLLGNDRPSREHADAAVALELEIGPPDGSPPEANDLFRMARRRLGGRTATLTIEAPRPLRLHMPGRVVARLEPSPPRLVGQLRLRCGTEEARGEPPSVELRVEPSADFNCSVDALSARGVPLLTFDRDLRVHGSDGGDFPDDGSDPGEHGKKAWPWVVGAVGVAAVVGVVVAVVLLRGEDGASFGNATVVGW